MDFSYDPDLKQRQQLQQIRGQFLELEQIAKQRVEPQDYSAQIDRWNAYITGLEHIQKEIKKQNMRGVTLAMNLQSNVQRLADDDDDDLLFPSKTLLLVFSLLAGVLPAPLFIIHEVPVWVSFLPFAGMGVALFAHGRLKARLPQVFKISVKPVLHIDELEYMRHFIKGVPEVQKDPEVYLPEMKLEVPRKVIAQMSLLDVMDQLGRINLPAGFGNQGRSGV